MDSDVPAESPTDRSASRLADETVVRAAPSGPSDAAERRTEKRRDDDFGERAVADRREVERLEAELERKEEQLRCVTERYEHLLAEKNRKLADASGSDASDGDSVSDRRTTLRARLARFLSSLR
ncbi:MAG: hypothetical protein R6U01_11260 [Halorubrum sp.]|uniref:hypothetical protein n=1 Tax=Halorubrum sp. TaxID=1879286 RepID=UPI0039705324